MRILKLRRLLRSDNDTSVSHLTILKLLHGLLDTLLAHGEFLNDGLDVVVSGESQHVSVDMSGGDQGTLDLELILDDWHVWDVHVSVGDSQWVDGGGRSHDVHELMPVWLERGGDDQVVNRS